MRLRGDAAGGKGLHLGDQVGDTISDGDRVFWLDRTDLDPVLHGYDARTDTRLAYALKGDVKKGLFFRGSEPLPFGAAIRPVSDLLQYLLTGAAPITP
mgnify:CR=1 FL=1